ncbi:hypothetical protein TNCV_1623061 [Trichonephila clavipes]|nr:hypothetical protein TNCV_1623061 [Trichonephila clavipes]
MGDLTYAENANMHCMYVRANGNGRAELRMYHVRFPDRRMPDHKIFSGYIVNFVKHVRSTPSDMVLVNDELFAVQAWKKASRKLWLIDQRQVQELLLIT